MSDTFLDGLEQLAPGVTGYTVEVDGITYVPWISATSPGSGDVGRFLDGLAVGTRVPNVINAKLMGMLKRRGWFLTYEFTPDGERVDVWVKLQREATHED